LWRANSAASLLLREAFVACGSDELCLKHLRALYELIEEMVCDQIIDKCPQRFQLPLGESAGVISKYEDQYDASPPADVVDRICWALGAVDREDIGKPADSPPFSSKMQGKQPIVAGGGGNNTSSTNDAQAALRRDVGRVRFEGPLKRFICRTCKESATDNFEKEPLLLHIEERFPWATGMELTEEMATSLFPDASTPSIMGLDYPLGLIFPPELRVAHVYALWKELKKKEREQLAAQQAAQEHRSRRAIPVVEPPSRPGATSRRPGQGQGGGRSLRR